MYWYNPKSRTSERVAAPTSDMQAICMACTHPVLCRVHKVLLRATPLGDADRASFGVSGTRVPLEASGVSASSPVGDVL
jgi:hypothetical protein